MDRRFICDTCGVKWFIPWTRPELADLTECDACGGGLMPFVAEAPEGEYGARSPHDPSPRVGST